MGWGRGCCEGPRRCQQQRRTSPERRAPCLPRILSAFSPICWNSCFSTVRASSLDPGDSKVLVLTSKMLVGLVLEAKKGLVVFCSFFMVSIFLPSSPIPSFRFSMVLLFSLSLLAAGLT